MPQGNFTNHPKRPRKYASQREAWAAYRTKNRDKINADQRKRHRATHLRYNYGMTVEEYNSKLKQQDYTCPICRQRFNLEKANTATSPHVDHDHSTGQVRDILCRSCNVALGLLQEKVDRLQAMQVYIAKWSDRSDNRVLR